MSKSKGKQEAEDPVAAAEAEAEEKVGALEGDAPEARAKALEALPAMLTSPTLAGALERRGPRVLSWRNR